MHKLFCSRRALGVLWITAVFGSAFPDTVHAGPRSEAEARALETRLRAPCCPTQLLDGHESELARALRRDAKLDAELRRFGPQ